MAAGMSGEMGRESEGGAGRGAGGDPGSLRGAAIGGGPIRSVTVDELSRRDLRALCTGETMAVVVRGFGDPVTAEAVARKLEELPNRSRYRNLRDELVKIGETLFEGASGIDPEPYFSGDPPLRDGSLGLYLDGALRQQQAIRIASLKGGDAPLDRLTELLREVVDADVLHISGRPAFAGLVRLMAPGRGMLPHQHSLGEYLPSDRFAGELQQPGGAELEANVYLRMPPGGGALLIWARHFSEKERAELRIPGSDYGLDVEKLPPPDAVVRPETGDLVFLNSRLLHAVTPPSQGAGVSLSIFVGFTPGGEVRYWS